MDKPSDLFDRDQEWADLAAFHGGDAPVRLGIVRGRRRQGKSWLLRRAVRAAGGIYVMALEDDRISALRRFGAAVTDHADLDGLAVQPTDWVQALRAATQVVGRTGRRLLVIDELPYLLAGSPEFPSALQAWYDELADRANQPPVRIVLCGSALSVMGSLLSGAAPLRGRASLDLRVEPFDYRTAAAFWRIDDPDVAFHVHAVLGGTPGYRAMAQAPVPTTLDDLEDWLARTALNPASSLFTEDEFLLREDPRIHDRALYQAILGAVAAGHRTQTAIGGAVGRDRTALAHPLQVLVSSGFLTAARDLRKQRGTIHGLADPIVRFHRLVTKPRLAELEERRTAAAWASAMPTFRSQILGPHFEDLARVWVRRYADPTTTGGEVGAVGQTVVADRAGRSAVEVDVVALAGGERPGRKDVTIRAIGEAKASDRPRTPADLDRLRRTRQLLATDGADCAAARLLLFGRSGFSRDLIEAAATAPDVELIDLQRLYAGA